MVLKLFLLSLNSDFMIKFVVPLCLILALAAFMRFYNLNSFGHFTGDEEIFHSLVKKVTVDHKPPIVIPNAQIGGSIGSLFVLLISPFFAVFNNDPIGLQTVGPFIGLATTLSMFWVGRIIGGVRMGILASVLYAGSFMVSLFDRRLWTLSLDPLMVTLTVGACIKVVNKNYKYFLLLVAAASFSWHSDPAIAIAALAAAFILAIFRVPVYKREFIPGWLYLFFSIAPFFVFELRHPGAIFKPWLIHLTERSNLDIPIIERLSSLDVLATIQNLSRSIFAASSQQIEQYYCYCSQYPTPLFSPIPEIVTIFVLAFGILWMLTHRKDKEIKILNLFIFSFLLGLTIYSLILAYDIYQHYFVTIFPVFLFLLSFTVLKLVKSSFQTILLLIFFAATNTFVLLNSSLQYPLFEKDKIVKQVIPNIRYRSFSVYGKGESMSLFDGGWVSLFAKNNLHPHRSYLNGGWDFIYRTHSLYSYNPDQKEGDIIIIFHDKNDTSIKKNAALQDRIESLETVENISATIINNNNGWFDPKLLQ